tara:strand:- start:858 stop:1004 length:147 start_codon:yes stop_codon:yes gene_type:complete
MAHKVKLNKSNSTRVSAEDCLANGVPVENGNYAGIKARALEVGAEVVI